MIGQIVLAVSLFFAALLIAPPLGILAWRIYSLHKFLEKSSEKLDPTTIPKLTEVIDKYNAGTVAIAEAQVAAIKSLEETIAQFRSLMFSNDGKGITGYDENAASAEWEAMQLQKEHGFSKDEADSRVRERRLYAGLNVGR